MSITPSTNKYGLSAGRPDLKSIGPIAFGPEGILFVADIVGSTIFAIDIGDTESAYEQYSIDIEKIDTQLAAYLGCSREDVLIRDMAVHPSSQNIYLSVMRGRGAVAIPVLIKVGVNGAISEIALGDVPFSQTKIENPPTEDDERTQWRLVQVPDVVGIRYRWNRLLGRLPGAGLQRGHLLHDRQPLPPFRWRSGIPRRDLSPVSQGADACRRPRDLDGSQ